MLFVIKILIRRPDLKNSPCNFSFRLVGPLCDDDLMTSWFEANVQLPEAMLKANLRIYQEILSMYCAIFTLCKSGSSSAMSATDFLEKKTKLAIVTK